jgi:hypothetical protein
MPQPYEIPEQPPAAVIEPKTDEPPAKPGTLMVFTPAPPDPTVAL